MTVEIEGRDGKLLGTAGDDNNVVIAQKKKGEKAESKPAKETTPAKPEAEKPEVPAKVPEKEAPKAEPTPEDTEEARRLFSAKFGHTLPPKKPKAEKPPEKKEVKKPEPEKPEKVEAEKPKKEVEAPKPDPEKEDEEDDELAKVLGEPPEKPAAPVEKPKPSGPTMDKAESVPSELPKKKQRLLLDLYELERTNPDQKGIANRMIKFWKLEDLRIQEWQKNHPGEKYDDEHEDHDDFYSKHEPEFDDADLDEAHDNRIKREIKETTSAESNRIKSEIQIQKEMEEAVPEIKARSIKAVLDMVKGATPGIYEKIVVNGEPLPFKEVSRIIQEEDPIAYNILNEAAFNVNVVVQELERLARFPEQFVTDENFRVKGPNKSTIYPHRMMLEFAKELEADMAKRPNEKTMRGNQKFMTQKHYSERVQRIQARTDLPEDQRESALRTLQDKFYTLGVEDVRREFINDQAKIAQEKIEEYNAASEKKAKRKAKPEKEEASKPDPEKADDEPESKRRKPSPSSASASDKVDTGGNGKSSAPTTGKVIADKTFA